MAAFLKFIEEILIIFILLHIIFIFFLLPQFWLLIFFGLIEF